MIVTSLRCLLIISGKAFYHQKLGRTEELAHSHRLACRRKSKSEVVIQIIQNYLELTWSPKQISNTILNV